MTHIERSGKVNFMRLFVIFLIFVFNFQILTKADDISDFEIEGISVGDSLIDFFDDLDLTEQLIKDYPKSTYPGSDKFYGLRINKELGDYDNFGVLLKKDDEKYIIYILRGRKKFANKLDECKNYKENVVSSIKSLLPNIEPNIYNHKYRIDDGKSISYITAFNIGLAGSIRIYCDNWSAIVEKNERWVDSLNIEISSEEALEWINNEAWE